MISVSSRNLPIAIRSSTRKAADVKMDTVLCCSPPHMKDEQEFSWDTEDVLAANRQTNDGKIWIEQSDRGEDMGVVIDPAQVPVLIEWLQEAVAEIKGK
jgi:hypothetical protein